MSCSNDDDVNQLLSSEKQITSFSIGDSIGTINQEDNNIIVNLPYGTDVTTLKADITIPEKATISPDPNQLRDYTNPVTYTVTAQDGSKLVYTITVIVAEITDRDVLIAIYKANTDNTLDWDITQADISSWQGVILENDRVVSLVLSGSALNITTLVPEIGNLTYLKKMSITFSEISIIPKEIGNLKQLEELTIFGSRLETLPIEIGSLNNLKKINMAQNSITSLPAEIGNLSSLTELFMRVNKIGAIPIEIDKLSNLESIVLTDNEITSVPPIIGSLSKLYRILLDGNNLTSLPIEIRNLTNLDLLRIQSNMITTVPREICDLANSGTEIQKDDTAICYSSKEYLALKAIYEVNPSNILGWDIANHDISTWNGVTVENGLVYQKNLYQYFLRN
ncbi:leucine-rich repeat domain-containing protein [Aquimarina sp. MMG016]|uniref:leucine-rich repeat domain-containing protein n=1 Tax=Aquimarina sp. MMG016 TaxID=2822690 RepID=UPI001B3A0E18|nr:leucine-rich repeat domain-containing protein [Aquimarina sp. MMG016]MBQ4821591.1 DUF5018 domain-containing protein [Aquimarina sp. MMG016]